MKKVDKTRRRFLQRMTAILGGIGLGLSTIPFIGAWMPSEKAKAQGGPIKVDLSDLKPGEQRTVQWRGKPIWIIRRTPDMLAQLDILNSQLRDPLSQVDQQPAFAKNLMRSIKKEYLILVGLCTHLGCIPTYRPDKGGITADWQGGFYCSCHGSKFDMAGRVFRGVPAPINLEVPPYVFLSDTEVLIGTQNKAAVTV